MTQGTITGGVRPSRQVAELVRLRWTMVRSMRSRIGLVLAAATVPGLALLAIAVGLALPQVEDTTGLLLITPSLLLGFFVLSVLAPLAAGGGTELFPADQLVAYPVHDRSVFLSGLLVAPLNLAWLLQVVVALGLLTYVAGGPVGTRLGATAVVLAYLAAATVAGQALAWAIVGVRRTRSGRWATWAAAGALVTAALVVLDAGRLTAVLDRSPTVWVVVGALAPGNDDWPRWAAAMAILVLTGAAAIPLGMAACRWTLRRPGDHATSAERPRRRRPLPARTSSMLSRLDAAGVWRTASLRRGALLLAVLPTSVLLVARPDPSVTILLPPLVCAGAGLLFGVNAFCLDGSGSSWLASQPLEPALHWRSRALAVAVVVAAPAAFALTATLVQNRASVSAAVALAAACAGAAAALRVSAWCLRWSIDRPHRADLVGPRDTPAPPGAMAVYALRLSVSMTAVGLLFSVLAVIGSTTATIASAAALAAFSLRSLHVSRRKFLDPDRRAALVAVMSG